MASYSKKCIVTSSTVLKECAVLKNSANVIKIIKSAALKAAVDNNPINNILLYIQHFRDVVRIRIGLEV